MDPHTEEAVTGLQCLLSVTDARDPQEFIVSLCKSGSPLDVLLQALLKVNESKKGELFMVAVCSTIVYTVQGLNSSNIYL